MRFWIWGEPGKASIVKVNAPSAIAPGISRLGIPASRNITAASGYTAKATTKSETPPYVRIAHASTTATIARRGPSARTIAAAIDPAAAAGLHQLAEDRPEQEQREERFDIPRRMAHERLGEAGQQRQPGKGNRQHREDGGEDDHREAPIGERHQQAQREENRDQFQGHGVFN